MIICLKSIILRSFIYSSCSSSLWNTESILFFCLNKCKIPSLGFGLEFLSLAVSSLWRSSSFSSTVSMSCFFIWSFSLCFLDFFLDFLWDTGWFSSIGFGHFSRTEPGGNVSRQVLEVYLSCWSSKMLPFGLKLSIGRSWVPRPSGVLGELELEFTVWGGFETGRWVEGSGEGVGMAAAAGGGRRPAGDFSLVGFKWPFSVGGTLFVRWDIRAFLFIRGSMKSESKGRFWGGGRKDEIWQLISLTHHTISLLKNWSPQCHLRTPNQM